MKNKILYIILILLIGLLTGLIILIKTDCNCNCENDNSDKIENKEIKEYYNNLSSKLVEYLNDIYNNQEYLNGKEESTTYTITLGEIKDKGYDISMFVNPNTKKACSLDKTIGKFIILGKDASGNAEFTYNTSVYCEE